MTNRVKQLQFWEVSQLPIPHHHIEVHYAGGSREIVCTGSQKPRHYREDEIGAGFVGGAAIPDECSICNPTVGRIEQ